MVNAEPVETEMMDNHPWVVFIVRYTPAPHIDDDESDTDDDDDDDGDDDDDEDDVDDADDDGDDGDDDDNDDSDDDDICNKKKTLKKCQPRNILPKEVKYL